MSEVTFLLRQGIKVVLFCDVHCEDGDINRTRKQFKFCVCTDNFICASVYFTRMFLTSLNFRVINKTDGLVMKTWCSS